MDQDDDEPEIQDNTDDESPVLHVDLSDLDQLQNPSTARTAYRDAITGEGC